jgi:hypothetical protein
MDQLDQMLQRKAQEAESATEQQVQESKAALEQSSPIVLEGINAPEFEQAAPITEAVTAEDLFENTRRPSHEQVVEEAAEEDTNPTAEEPERDSGFPCNGAMMDYEDTNRVFDLHIDQLYDLSTRTKNALRAAGVVGLSDLHGLAQADLLALKGFGKNSLEEIFSIFAKNPDLDLNSFCKILKRRPRKGKYEVSEEYLHYTRSVERFQNLNSPDSKEAPIAEVVSEASEHFLHSLPSWGELAQVVEETAPIAPIVEETAPIAPVAPIVEETAPVESELERSITETLTRPKILVIGASVSGDIDVQNFESVYAQHIEAVKTRHNVKSISLVEYAKGWADLSALVAESGWGNAQAIRLTRFARQEIISVMSEIADIVVEA